MNEIITCSMLHGVGLGMRQGRLGNNTANDTVFIMAAIQLTKYNGSNHTQKVIATIYNA